MYNHRILLADEISPDGCRLWKKGTTESMDKDLFRKDEGDIVEAYSIILEALKNSVKIVSMPKFPMYREPHLQRQSDLCASIWKEWYYYKYNEKDEAKASKRRKLWCRCIEEFESNAKL